MRADPYVANQVISSSEILRTSRSKFSVFSSANSEGSTAEHRKRLYEYSGLSLCASRTRTCPGARLAGTACARCGCGGEASAGCRWCGLTATGRFGGPNRNDSPLGAGGARPPCHTRTTHKHCTTVLCRLHTQYVSTYCLYSMCSYGLGTGHAARAVAVRWGRGGTERGIVKSQCCRTDSL